MPSREYERLVSIIVIQKALISQTFLVKNMKWPKFYCVIVQIGFIELLIIVEACWKKKNFLTYSRTSIRKEKNRHFRRFIRYW